MAAVIHQVEDHEIRQSRILIAPAGKGLGKGLHGGGFQAGHRGFLRRDAGINIGGAATDQGEIGRQNALGPGIEVEPGHALLVHQVDQGVLAVGIYPKGQGVPSLGNRLGGGKARGRGDPLHILHNPQLGSGEAEKQRGGLGHLGGDGIGLRIAVFGGDHQGKRILPLLKRQLPVTLDGGVGVGGSGGERELLGALGQGEGILGHSRVKGRGQGPGADGESGEGIVAALARGAGGVVRLAVVRLGGGDDGHRGAAGGIIVHAGHAVGAGGDPHGAGAGVIGPEHELVGAVIPLKTHGGQVAGLQCEVSGIGHGIGPRLRPGRHGDGKGHGTAHADGALPGGHRHSRSIAHLQEGEKHGAQQRKAHKGFFQ